MIRGQTDPKSFPSSARASVTISLCFAMGVLEGFDIQVMGVAAPRMSVALGLDATAMTLLFLASNIGLLIGASVGGRLADLYGRRPVIIGSALIFGSFTLATAFASALPAIVAARLVAGLGLGAALPNMVAAAADVSRPQRLGLTTAAMFCGIPLGGALVALASQSDLIGSNWRMLFVIGGVLPLLLAIVQWFYLAETRSREISTVPPPPARHILFGEGRLPSTLLLWAAVAPTLMALYLILYWLPTLLTQKGFDPALASQASAVFNVGGVIGALCIGVLVDRFSARAVLGSGYLAFVATAVLLSKADDQALVLMLSATAGFLILGLNYAVYGIVGSCYPAAGRATGTGAALSVGRLGSVIGPTLPGFLIVAGFGPGAILWLLAPIATLAGIAIVALGNIQRTKG